MPLKDSYPQNVIIELPGEPRGKERPRYGRGRVYTPNKTAAYERSLGWAARVAMGSRKPLLGPLKVTVTAFVAKPVGKPDADNILKCLDSFNKIVWDDDSQIVDARIVKVCGVPMLRIEVEPYLTNP
jgi:Holliday junction resolvase RusA-like endonuclease